jgi:hypothetical protein
LIQTWMGRLPLRRKELLAATGLLLVALWYFRLNVGNESASFTLIAILELLLPLPFSLVVAGIFAGDPAMELLQAAPRPAFLALMERIAIILGSGAGMGAAFLILARAWRVYLPMDGSHQVLIWLSPLILLAGVASLGSLARGKVVDGILAALLVWLASAASRQVVGLFCQEIPLERACPAALLSPALTSVRPLGPDWLFNRFLWLGTGVVFLAVSLRLAGNEERLVKVASNEISE